MEDPECLTVVDSRLPAEKSAEYLNQLNAILSTLPIRPVEDAQKSCSMGNESVTLTELLNPKMWRAETHILPDLSETQNKQPTVPNITQSCTYYLKVYRFSPVFLYC